MTNTLKKWVLSSSILSRAAIFFRRLYLKRTKGITYQKNAFIGFSVKCEGKNGFGKNSAIVSSKIGYASYIAEGAKLAKTSIGRYCSIGPRVNCIFGKHPSNTFVSTHPTFFALKTPVGFTYSDKQYFEEFATPHTDGYSITIGNDVWLGANVSLMDGVRIGDGAIVAANALVTKDVAPYTIVGGVPAKPIKKRFTDEEIDFLMDLKWWDKPRDWIQQNAAHFRIIKDLKDQVGANGK
ncbi:CatB-related O-acetyltransferase [Flagellimonas myxillae]|uniref:CatB-related O-acetyltransferase n=1 Tax=Flagellimonas myxillae TaxID=2942214 RepID=UPI00201F8921|nr:CatB-related O-acetyltransferase [Muricauda myxillae]MCL6266234.1 CatB-related O-acetyltransferase [Muricauda myxillae]